MLVSNLVSLRPVDMRMHETGKTGLVVLLVLFGCTAINLHLLPGLYFLPMSSPPSAVTSNPPSTSIQEHEDASAGTHLCSCSHCDGPADGTCECDSCSCGIDGACGIVSPPFTPDRSQAGSEHQSGPQFTNCGSNTSDLALYTTFKLPPALLSKMGRDRSFISTFLPPHEAGFAPTGVPSTPDKIPRTL